MDDSSSSSSSQEQDWLASDENVSDVEDTIEEEEALEQDLTPEEELRLLSEDMNINVNELVPRARRSYNDNLPTPTCSAGHSTNEVETDSVPSVNDDKLSDVSKMEDSDLKTFYLTRVVPNVVTRGDSDDDADFDVSKLLKVGRKVIRVGEPYQADLDFTVNDTPTDGELLWKPTDALTDETIQEYLRRVKVLIEESFPGEQRQSRDDNAIVPDNAVALQTLMSCNYNITEALIKLSNNRELQKIMNEQLSNVVSKINDSGDSEIKRDDSEIKRDDSEIKRDELVEEVDIENEESPSKKIKK